MYHVRVRGVSFHLHMNFFSSLEVLDVSHLMFAKTKAVGKLVTLLFIVIFLCPSQLLLAQESTTTDEAAPAEAATTSEAETPPAPDIQSPAATPDESVPEATPEEPKSPPTPMFSSPGGDVIPTIANTDLFSSQTSAPKVEDATGALLERVPLAIPPGRNNLTPDLALAYNSQDLVDTIVGYGWSLSIPYIQRLNKTGVDALYTDNYFTSSLGGELATTTTTNEYRQRIEDGRFIKYTFANNIWTAYDKNGTRYLFGTTTAAQQSATTSPSNVYKWMLEEVRDTNDNFIRYEYTNDYNEIYPSKIVYTGSGSNDGIFEVDFTYATRTDPVISYKSGFKVTTNKRLTEVQAFVNGSWVREYDLSYSAGTNGARSLLNSVQEKGQDASSNQLTLPALMFAYSSTTPSYVAHTNPQMWNAARVAADADGNGLPEQHILKNKICGGNASTDRDSQVNTYPTFTDNDACPVLTSDDYWATTSSWDEAVSPVERGVRMFDVNGDGKADIIRGYSDSSGALSSAYYEKQSSYTWSATPASTSSIPAFAYNDGATTYSTGLLGDVNNDGLIDFALSLPAIGSHQPSNSTYLHSATSSPTFASTGNFSAPYTLPTDATSQDASELVDINGDGLPDWMRSSSGGTTVFCLNTGTGWDVSCTSPWTISTSTRQVGGWDRGIRFIDVNGDGLPDYVRGYNVASYSSKTVGTDVEVATKNYVYLNTGNGFATSSLTLPGYITAGHPSTAGVWDGHFEYNEMVDWNGDGIPDEKSNTSTSTTATARQDILDQIVYPTTGTTTVAYQFTTQSASDNSNMPFPILVVTNITDQDGMGNSKSTNYSYEGAKLYLPANVRDRRVADFKSITKIDPLAKTVTYFDQGDGVDSGTGEQSDGFALIGKPYREDVISLASTTMRQTFNKWTDVSLGETDRHFVYLSNQLVQMYDGNSDHRDTATEFTYSTTTGDLTQHVQKGEVVGSSDGTYADIGSDTITKAYTYAASSTVNMSVPSQETVTNSASTQVKLTDFYYDSLATGLVNKGNITKEEDWITGSSYASSTKAYNTYGLVATSTDPRAHSTTFVYDAFNLYVATSTNPLSQTTQTLYDYATGKPTQITDANSRSQQFSYDPVGRITETKVPDPTSGSLVTQSALTYTDTIFPSKVQRSDYLNSATSTDIYTYFDGFGRPIQERKEASSYYIVTDKIYAPSGLLGTTSLPYFSSGTSRTTATTSASLFIGYTYDALGRVTDVTNAQGTEVHSYDQWIESVTDRNGNIKDLTQDAFGNLQQVDEHNATSTLSYLDQPDNLASGPVKTVALGKAHEGRDVVAIFGTLGGIVTEADQSATPISDMLKGKSSHEQANIKAAEFAKLDLTGEFEDAARSTRIEIQSLHAIDGGIELFARAWKGSEQMGFGPDGSVEIERFRIFNPPILVPDGTKHGEVVQGQKIQIDNFKEDLPAALRQTLAHTISLAGKTNTDIEVGKVGRTTDTYYPSLDGTLCRSNGNETWATIHDASSGLGCIDSGDSNYLGDILVLSGSPSNKWGQIMRRMTLFDTSALPDSDNINTATLSYYSDVASTDNYTQTIDVASSSPGSDGSFADTDYALSHYGATIYATKTIASYSTGGVYNDFSLNASGIANVSKTGTSRFSTRLSSDVTNSEPTWQTGQTRSIAWARSLAHAGTTEDPKLVVSHSANSAPTAPTSVLIQGQTNPTNVTVANPTFSAIYNDPDTTDVALSYQIQVGTSSAFTTTLWDSTKTSLASSTPQGTRIANITYGGSAMASSTIYYMRIKFWDTADAAGAWSDTFTFTLGTHYNATQYTYDALNNLTKITDVLGNVRNFTYDGLSRLTNSEDLHASGDGTYGATTYSYDVGSNLTSKTDPKSQVVNYTYDNLNRVTAEDYTGASGTEIAYAYDTCTDGKGRLCIATTTDAVSTYAYNPLGLQSSETTRVNAINYTTSYSYDREGNYTDVTYPDTSIVHYTFDDAGLLNTVARKSAQSSTYANAMIAMHHAPTGAISYKQFGNGVTSTYTYDATQLYRLTNINTVASTTWAGGGSLAMRSTVNGRHFALNPSAPRPLALATPQLLSVATFGEIGSVDATTTAATTSVSALLEGKSRDEQANIKSDAYAQLNLVGDYDDATYGLRFEIQKLEKINGGIQVFARAWKNDHQLGFGPDGSVEIERFRIFNPPILIPDGTKHTETKQGQQIQVDNFKEDLPEALRITLGHIISIVGKQGTSIVMGKVGRTTDTYYPSLDGALCRSNGNESWATIHDATSALGCIDSGDSNYLGDILVLSGAGSNLWGQIIRRMTLFDTAALPDSDDINSATLSYYSDVASTNNYTQTIDVSSSTPASDSSFADGDYAFTNYGKTVFASTTIASYNTGGVYNDFSLNAAGIANVSKTGKSKFATLLSSDLTNTEPTWQAGQTRSIAWARSLAHTGTTEDPKLVVTHSAPATAGLQNISYTYDAVGNITDIQDTSDTTANKHAQFVYDNLNRLTQASTTNATANPYRYQFAYNALGNIVGLATSTATGTTTYAYAGTGDANPHAATSFGATTYTYDNNGNLTNARQWTYAWDYRNRLTSAGNGLATTTFGYNQNDQRVWMHTSANATTTYPVKFFETTSTLVGATTTATTTTYLFAGDEPVATVQGNGTATTTRYIHPDHLGSTNVTTDETGTLAQTVDYYPYGSERVDANAGTVNAERTFIGQFGDTDTNLSYLQARYMDPARGQFLSEDPSVVNVDLALLSDPQQLNTYSYARGNPLAFTDKDGRKVELVTRSVIGLGAHSFVLITNTPTDAAKLTGVPAGITDPTRITLGGYASIKNPYLADFGNLVKSANNPDDFALSEKNYFERTQILPPTEYKGSETNFENAVLQSYDKLNADLGAYSFFGDPRFNRQNNSNNTATSILGGAGVDNSLLQGYRPTSLYPFQTPGLGTPVSHDQRQSLADGLKAIVGTLTAIRNALKK